MSIPTFIDVTGIAHLNYLIKHQGKSLAALIYAQATDVFLLLNYITEHLKVTVFGTVGSKNLTQKQSKRNKRGMHTTYNKDCYH